MVAYTSSIHVADPVAEYVARLAHATQNRSELLLGASPRASLSVVRTAQAWAAIEGRAYVTPDDVKAVAEPVLGHRLLVNPEAEIRGARSGEVLTQVLRSVPAPAPPACGRRLIAGWCASGQWCSTAGIRWG